MATLHEDTTFICLFHNRDRARSAMQALADLGISQGAVRTLGDGERSTDAQDLQTLGVPDRDLRHLQDGLEQGGIILSLHAPEDQSTAIEKIFHHYSADKIDEAELQLAEPLVEATPVPVATMPAGTAVAEGVAVLPIAEEELVVGKREVDRGGVRVYRRTVEQPVEEQINLHGERVVLEYRETNRPATEADLRAAGQEIELIETAEVPVVEKVARVVEEVRVGKVQSDHIEVVEDTVRHTEVEIEPVNELDRP